MLNELAKEIHENSVNKGFYSNPIETGTLLMLCVSELSEALEADRIDNHADLESYELFECSFESCIKDTFEDELADSLIRILDLCAAKNIDIDTHVKLKMEYNKGREKLHGKKY